MSDRLDPLEDLTGDLFVDRHDELEMFWKWATDIPKFSLHSFALIGRRRTGKTAILIKLFNRLFYEQKKVLPVFISFAQFLHRQEPLSSYEFAEHYFSGYIRSYFAFRYREPMFLRQRYRFNELRQFAHQVSDEYALNLFKRYDSAADRPIPFGLVDWVINFPSGEAAVNDMPTAMIVDEFQVLTNVYDPRQDIHHDLTDSFQHAVETRWAPMLLSGSAVSLFVSQALGGMLQGRFRYHYLKPILREYTHDLTFRLGDDSGISVTEELAEAIWQLTDGNPHSVQSLMNSTSPAQRNLPDIDALEEVVTYELSNPNGQLWQHYSHEFEKFSHQLNEGKTTRHLMLWVTKYPDQRVDADITVTHWYFQRLVLLYFLVKA
ncbi:hypothetical protein KFU94_13995 [Chloroflexi bacterium TSY]|nr:hypothetical protein [Chloroflexi bacterium TSY]